MKRPRSFEGVLSKLARAAAVGQGRLTAYTAAKAWGVSPSTARAWLNKWAELGLLVKHRVEHRPNVFKTVFERSDKARAYSDFVFHDMPVNLTDEQRLNQLPF